MAGFFVSQEGLDNIRQGVQEKRSVLVDNVRNLCTNINDYMQTNWASPSAAAFLAETKEVISSIDNAINVAWKDIESVVNTAAVAYAAEERASINPIVTDGFENIGAGIFTGTFTPNLPGGAVGIPDTTTPSEVASHLQSEFNAVKSNYEQFMSDIRGVIESSGSFDQNALAGIGNAAANFSTTLANAISEVEQSCVTRTNAEATSRENITSSFSA